MATWLTRHEMEKIFRFARSVIVITSVQFRVLTQTDVSKAVLLLICKPERFQKKNPFNCIKVATNILLERIFSILAGKLRIFIYLWEIRNYEEARNTRYTYKYEKHPKYTTRCIIWWNNLLPRLHFLNCLPKNMNLFEDCFQNLIPKNEEQYF